MTKRKHLRAGAVVALAVALIAPGFAMPADRTEVTEYGKSGKWTLRKVTAGGEVVSCDAYLLTGSERGLRYEYNRASHTFGFSGWASAASERPIDVEMWFDNKRDDSEVYSMALENDAQEFPWRNYTATNDEPDPIGDDMLLTASKVSFAYMVQGEGEKIETYSLAGLKAAELKTIDCVNNATVAAAEPPPPEPASDYQDKSTVIRGTCKLVVDGKTYVDIKKTCPIWMANDGTGTFWINTDRDSALPDYFAEIEPNGDGTAQGHWNGIKGAAHAQAFLGEDFRLKKGGCWSNARATICASK